jgi:hypothetical protein
MSSENDKAILRSYANRARDLARSYQQQVAANNNERPFLMPAEHQRRAQRVRSDQELAVLQGYAQAQAARERLLAARDYALGEAGRNADAGRQMATTAAWARIQAILAQQRNLPERIARLQLIIAEATKRGDVAAFRALRENLAAELELSEPYDVRARREAAGKPFDARETAYGPILQQIERAARPHLTSEEALASEIDEFLEPFAWAVEGAHERLTMQLDEPFSPAVQAGFMDWQKGQLLKMDGSTVGPDDQGE